MDGTVDVYASTVQPAQIVWTSAEIGAVGHTLRVGGAGAKNAASRGTKVDINAYLSLK